MSYIANVQMRVTAADATTPTLQPQTPGYGSSGDVPSQIVITWAVRPVEFIVGALFPLVKILASV